MDVFPDATVSEPIKAAVSAPSFDMVELADGLTLGSVTYHSMTLRALTARDLMAAQDEAEKVVATKDGLSLVTSPARLAQELLRRQVRCLTEGEQVYNGPLTISEIGRLSLRDLAAMQAGADNMDAADALRTGEGMSTRGRDLGGAERA